MTVISLNKIKALAESKGFATVENAMMKSYTTFRIGGPAELLIECNDIRFIKDIIDAIKQEKLDLMVIGKGSNLLVSDKGIKGVVVCICDDKVSVEGNVITCNAGALLSKICLAAKDNSLTGLEFAWGIPGSVGGAVYMNAGAYGGEIKQVVSSVTSITRDGEVVTRLNDELELGYRTSVFKSNDEIILSAKFNLQHGDKAAINANMSEILGRRKDKQPLEFASAGSTFKRPQGYFAGALIEDCNLKGCAFGDAMVSTKHAGFVINKGNASSADVMNLIKHIQDTVYRKHGVMLETEVIYCGE